MGSIATNKNQVTLYYNSGNSIGKQALAYLKSSLRSTRSIDISKTKISGTQWLEIVDKLNLSLADLINQSHPDFKSEYEDITKLSTEDWIKIIQCKPQVLNYPILIVGNTYYRIKTPSQITKLLESEGKSQDARSKN